ncbi:DEAD/DEAH box helicase [Protaetiibacter intestinalis]|uniref:DEAD/DEAH box helicase n=1 Tax=Protaetiibacter intestinalis TaxID=2419774 RepID=A0A387B6Z5_9MICO|nr:DEAD/DEAH box helicase family protein [Protaetiibacter intestinalis]AYF98117.1 DEAD/DEAH box helicase [Protaetiibacter intestinalis]
MEPEPLSVDDEFAYAQEHTGPKWRARQFLPGKESALADAPPTTAQQVLESWPAGLLFREEDKGAPGLRRPQAGAVHSLHGYWTTDPRHPATVVMPTGTGKTDTMVAAMLSARIEKLLVLVPSDALRDQLATKFERLGVLRQLGLVDPGLLMPVVGRLSGALTGPEDADRFADCCNVVISTPNALAYTEKSVRSRFLERFTHLFIDEAHHVAAETWRQVRDSFAPRPVIQFTATPHRTDGQHLGGSMIYAFPLREAQKQGYFSTIRYRSVLDLLEPDQAIAVAAIEQLRADHADGLDHLVMARAKSIRRAEEVQSIYAQRAPEYAPVLAHSQLGKRRLADALDALKERKSRILVCVDMFGEGFDLPQLKIAALHDQHRSLGITLQFIGRFARNGTENVGQATVVAARSEVRQDEALRRLYAEDADWNLLVEDLSNQAVEDRAELDEFTKAFSSLPDEVSIHSLTPAMSTVVYHVGALTWRPERVLDVFGEDDLLTYPVPTSQRDHVLWFVTRKSVTPRWGDVSGVDALEHHLYVVYWDSERGLLYINSSDNDSVHEDLARAISGDAEAHPLRGEDVYRVFDQVQRLTPNNIGLLDARSRSRRYTSYVGSDVTEAFPAAEAQTKSQTHIAGTGFLEGKPFSIAGSLKGRVWSHRTASDIREWVKWCDVVGPKIVDESIDVDHILAGFIRPVALTNWPALRPLAVEVPHRLSEILEDAGVEFSGSTVDFSEVDLVLGDEISLSERRIYVSCDAWRANYSLRITDAGLSFQPERGDQEVSVHRTRASTPLSELVRPYGLRVLLERDAIIEPPGLLLQPNRVLPAFPLDRLTAMDWVDVDIRKESWGSDRNPATVQGRMVAQLLEADWDIVVDDDGPGEIADIVAVREVDDALVVRLVHCKFSSADTPGARLDDLYELAGQGQRSAGWRRNVGHMVAQLIRRERNRAKRGRSGLIHGTIEDLVRLSERAAYLRPRLTIVLAQPGLSKTAASPNVLELLSSVDLYVAETALSELEVYCSS